MMWNLFRKKRKNTTPPIDENRQLFSSNTGERVPPDKAVDVLAEHHLSDRLPSDFPSESPVDPKNGQLDSHRLFSEESIPIDLTTDALAELRNAVRSPNDLPPGVIGEHLTSLLIDADVETQKGLTQALGSKCVFDRQSQILGKPIGMQVKVFGSFGLASCIGMAIQGAFSSMETGGFDKLEYHVIDYALPGKDSEPLRRVLLALQRRFTWVHIHLYRKVVRQNGLMQAMSLASPKMKPVICLDAISGIVEIPLSVQGCYANGEPEEEACEDLYETYYLPLLRRLKEQGDETSIAELSSVVEQAKLEVRSNLRFIRQSEGFELTAQQWDLMQHEEQFGHLLTVGRFAVVEPYKSEGPAVLLYVDFCEDIPCCCALALLLHAMLPGCKKQIIDAGEGADSTALKDALVRLNTCNTHWVWSIH